MLRPAILLSAILILLAACGPLPRPFQPDGKDEVDMRNFGEQTDILIEPLSEDEPGWPAAPDALARALRDYGYRASSRAGVAERVLSGRAVVQALSPDRDEVLIDWELTTIDGEPIASHSQRSELPGGLWLAGQPAAVSSVMAEAAKGLARVMPKAPPRPEGLALDEGPKARLVLVPMELLPGDGALSLTVALENELRAANYEIGWDIEDGDLLVLGDMALEPAEPGWEEVTFTWWVVRASDGQDLGQIDQQNRLPAGSLEGRWGATAQAIAEGAAEGIIDLLRRILGPRASAAGTSAGAFTGPGAVDTVRASPGRGASAFQQASK